MCIPPMSYFRAIHNTTGLQYAKDAKIADFQNRFAVDFDTSVNVVHGALRNDEPQDFIIVPTDTGCNLWARPEETFNIGDIIYYNTLHWLVTDINFHDDMTRSGEMVRCNRQIRWQNQETGEIIERWCLATKPYTSNVAEGMAIATSNREFKIQVTYDEETILVDLDRRFLLEVINGQPKAYQVTSVDTLTNRYQDVDGGFLVWNLKQCEYNPATDNADLMIADYIAQVIPPAPAPGLLVCEIDGRYSIRCDTSRVYRPIFYEQDGVTVDSSVIPQWTVQTTSSVVQYVVNGSDLTLSVSDDTSAEGEIITITLCDVAGLYAPISMQVEVIGLL